MKSNAMFFTFFPSEPIMFHLFYLPRLQEQSLKHMQKQLQRLSSAHLRRLERAYVEEAMARCFFSVWPHLGFLG